VIYLALGPDPASMPMHNALNRGQPDAGAFKRLRRMEALETRRIVLFTYFMSNPTPLSRMNSTA